MIYAVIGVVGFAIGVIFGAKIVADIKSEFVKGFADIKTFVSAELAKIKL